MTLRSPWARPATLVLLSAWAASAAARPAPSDSSDALTWARRAAETRRSVQAAVAGATPAALGAEYRETWALYEASVARSAAERAAAARAVAVREAARAAAVPARAAVAGHLFVPAGSEALVGRQTSVVQRRFGSVGRRGARYFPMIERALRRRGLPADLKYVAVIESALNPNAVSSAGAAGLWQFMPDTAADFGLDSLGVRDPARATDAAVRYLERLHRAFGGDWQLALAAYNCGPGRVRRLVDAHRARTGRTPTFWDLHGALPAETRDYVPRFIAVAQHFGSGRLDA
ncbi:MAG TPA: lytic transglycosylase domain-containing protein [Rubricoccaceae bacterium]|jgi:soluble lytic murein transglycosylase-like protein